MDNQPESAPRSAAQRHPEPGLMRRFVSLGPAALVLTTAGLTLLAGPEAIRQIQTAQTSAAISVAQQSLDEDSLLERFNQSVRNIATAVEPSVVYIEARSDQSPRRAGRSTGSGWVYDANGHIVTNAHVIAGAERIRVNFYDGAVRDATFVGMDESTDIAVIKVEGAPGSLFPMRRATAQPVFQGDAVFAFGSPFGFKFSMSKGIVSGLGRDAVTDRRAARYSNFIQTDAAINPGNSGGPLVDVNGRVIGMNTAIITDIEMETLPERQNTGVSMGIGFAIPLETIEAVASQLIGKGLVLRGFMGASLADVEEFDRFNPQRIKDLGYDRRTGVVVTDTPIGLPAHKAGMQVNDIITHVDGRPTPNTVVLRSVIANQRPDATVRITVFREGAPRDIDVTLIAAAIDAQGRLSPIDPDAAIVASPRRPFGELPESEDAAGAFAPLRTLGITLGEAEAGLAIVGVAHGSAAARAGLTAGDIVRFVADTPVATRRDLLRALMRRLAEPVHDELPLVIENASGVRRTVVLERAER